MSSPAVAPDAESQADKVFPPESRRRTFLLGLVLAAAIVAVYWPVHRHPFSGLDDYIYLVDNVNLQVGLDWDTVRWCFRAMYMANWIPLTWLWYALDFQLFGLQPAGHHLVNVALHALNAVLVFWVLRRATGYSGRSFMVAALFALHPVNVEPVVWVAELKTVLSMVFFLLALQAYRWYALRPRWDRYALLGLLFGLGLLAKAQVITLPFLLLLWDYWPLQRMFPNAPSCSPPHRPVPPRSFSWLVLEKLPLLVPCALDAALTIYTQKGVRLRYLPPLSWRLKNAVFSYMLYLRNCYWPSGLGPEMPQLGRILTGWQVFGALVLLLAITALVVWARRYRYLPVGWFWFLGALVPMLGILQAGQQGMADRFVYQAYLGLFIIVCWGVADWARKHQISVAWPAAAGAVVLLALTVVTHRQIDYWEDPLKLWSHAAAVVKNHWLAEDNVAFLLLKQGKNEEAMPHFRRAAALNPTDSGSNIQIAQYEQKRGNLRDAIAHYQAALLDNDIHLKRENRVKVWVNMAVAYRDLGDAANAQRSIEEARRARSLPE